jgi:glycosyltransferase involved in cell wall biosynthesis
VISQDVNAVLADRRPIKVSACMAVYNGAAFLSTQIDSILGQLRPGDEFIIVDDASRDASVSIVRGIQDARVRLHRNARNQGVLAAVEQALRLASGEIVFLSDQDDIWLPGKVQSALDVFALYAEVTLVASDANIINAHGQKLSDSFYSRRGRFSGGFLHNLAKNKYLGCTLAFRRRMLDYFLPIPADVPMHDMWFGVLNSLYGKAYFIDQPLVAYRRHDRNASPFTHAGFRTMALWRWRLLRNVVRRAVELASRRPPLGRQ